MFETTQTMALHVCLSVYLNTLGIHVILSSGIVGAVWQKQSGKVTCTKGFLDEISS